MKTTLDRRWSPDPLPDLGKVLEFLQLIWAVDQGLQRSSKQMEMTTGITISQRIVIRIVGRFPGIPAGHLARLLHIHPGTLSGMVNRLERQGLVRRRQDPRDGRRTLLGLTEKGRSLGIKHLGAVETAIERLFEHTPESNLRSAREVLMFIADTLASAHEQNHDLRLGAAKDHN